MKFKIERKSLQKALALANSVVERSNVNPILGNVLLDASDGALRITATDLDIQIRQAINAEVIAPGRITVSSAMLQDIVRKLADGPVVECELIEPLFHVRSGRSKLKLFSLPAEDFPDLEVGRMDTEFSIDSADLCRLIRKASFVISTDESRYFLNGVYLHRRENDLACVGTDGHRLSMAWMPGPEGSEKFVGVILPKKTSALVARHVDGHDGSVVIRASESKISFEWGGVVLVSKLIDGSYPDYDRVIPKSNQNIMRADTKALMTAVDRVATVSTEKGRACRLTLGTDSIEVSMIVPDGGTAEDTLDIEYRGEPMAIGFNSRYVIEVLANVGSEGVVWEIGNPGGPAVVKPEDGDTDCMAVLMPMRF